MGEFMFTVFIQVSLLNRQVADDADMNLDEYSKEKLWQLLVEAVHASVMYPTHKAYTRDTHFALKKRCFGG